MSFSICTSTPTRGPGAPSRWQHAPRAQLLAPPRPACTLLLRWARHLRVVHHPTDYPIALGTDLQVRPPGSDYCRTCASATGDGLRSIGPDGRHWVSCPHGLRLQRSVHHPVRDTLAWLLTAVLGERMVIRETPDGGGRMGSFMRRFPRLGHQPDIVLEGFDGRDTTATRSWRSRRVSLPETPISRASTRTPRGARRTATSSRP